MLLMSNICNKYESNDALALISSKYRHYVSLLSMAVVEGIKRENKLILSK